MNVVTAGNMGYNRNIHLYILCSVLTAAICVKLPCDYNVTHDANIDFFGKNELFIGESEAEVQNCLCNPEKCVYKCCPMGEEVTNLTCQDSPGSRMNGLKTYVGSYLELDGFSVIHQQIDCFDAGMTRFVIDRSSSTRRRP